MRAQFSCATCWADGVLAQAVGPVAITSLLLSNGLADLIPGADANIEPNDPADPQAQHEYNIAAIQVMPII